MGTRGLQGAMGQRYRGGSLGETPPLMVALTMMLKWTTLQVLGRLGRSHSAHHRQANAPTDNYQHPNFGSLQHNPIACRLRRCRRQQQVLCDQESLMDLPRDPHTGSTERGSPDGGMYLKWRLSLVAPTSTSPEPETLARRRLVESKGRLVASHHLLWDSIALGIRVSGRR